MSRASRTTRRRCVYTIVKSPVGRLTLVATDAGLAAILWENDRPQRVPLDIGDEDAGHPVLVQAARQLEEYFAGARKEFALTLDVAGTSFQRKVWDALRTIPFGETRSYAQIAAQIGHRAAVRAVGAANSRNPVSIVAPCHRVIGSTGNLTGFAGGVGVKAWLLAFEESRLSRQVKETPVSEHVRAVVREKYGQAALRARGGEGTSCCGASPGLESACDPITSNLYDTGQEEEVPDLALKASLGCGNPTALAELKPGETVLDLGSGGGIDVLLSARRVGPTGKAYGLDMTDEMLALAADNKRKSGLENVEFLKGEIEHIPLPDNSVDVIISNCVINLSGDKDRVLGEAFRVLKPGGRFAVSDVVVRGAVPVAIRKSMELWVGCVAGALAEDEYVAKLAGAGFEGIEIETTRVYGIEDARTFLAGQGLDADAVALEVDGRFISGFIRASKPAAAWCAPGGCD